MSYIWEIIPKYGNPNGATCFPSICTAVKLWSTTAAAVDDDQRPHNINRKPKRTNQLHYMLESQMGIYYNSLKTWIWHYTAGPKEKKHTKTETPVRKKHTSRQRIGNSEKENPVEGNDNNQTKRRELSRRKFIQRTKNTKPELRKWTTETGRELRILQ